LKQERSATIITAWAALHNLGRQLLNPSPPVVPLLPLPKPFVRRPGQSAIPPPLDTGTNVRNLLIASHFT
ncbi:hypothetical protein HPB47_001011, partial [Ixodes persulcatus]